MSFETIDEKIAFLDDLVGGTLTLAHYSDWELASFAENSLFAHSGSVIGHVCAPGFTECIDKAFHLAWETVGNV